MALSPLNGGSGGRDDAMSPGLFASGTCVLCSIISISLVFLLILTTATIIFASAALPINSHREKSTSDNGRPDVNHPCSPSTRCHAGRKPSRLRPISSRTALIGTCWRTPVKTQAHRAPSAPVTFASSGDLPSVLPVTKIARFRLRRSSSFASASILPGPEVTRSRRLRLTSPTGSFCVSPLLVPVFVIFCSSASLLLGRRVAGEVENVGDRFPRAIRRSATMEVICRPLALETKASHTYDQS